MVFIIYTLVLLWENNYYEPFLIGVVYSSVLYRIAMRVIDVLGLRGIFISLRRL
jgi:hypothetical protein